MNIHLLLVPYDTAQRGWRSGAGPESLLQSGLVAHLGNKGHRVTHVQFIEDNPDLPPAEIRTTFELARRLAVAVHAARAQDAFPLVLSGNCCSAIGALSGLTPARRAVFWFDAHGDCNTPDTTTSGCLDGTGLATALGLGWRQLAASVPGFVPLKSEDIFLLGVRDLDPAERSLIAETPIMSIPVADMSASLPSILEKAPLDDALGYLHLDLDVLDPGVGQANSLPVAGGVSVEQLVKAIAAIRVRTPLGAAALTCYTPGYDTQQSVRRAAFAAIDAIVANPALTRARLY